MIFRFICLVASVCALVSNAKGQAIDGLVMPDQFPNLGGKPIEIQIVGQKGPMFGEFVKVVTQKKTGQLIQIEFKSERQQRIVKPTQVISLKVDKRPHSLRLHVPTGQYLLIDEMEARIKADARLKEKDAKWTELQDEIAFDAASAKALVVAEQIKDSISDASVQLLVGETAILLTDFDKKSCQALLKTADQVIPNLNKMFGVNANDGSLMNGKVVLGAFRARELFGKLETSTFKNPNYGTYPVIYHEQDGILVVNTNDARSVDHLIWQMCWGFSGGYANRARTSLDFPVWLRVAIQQSISDALVPSVTELPVDRRRVADFLKKSGSLNGLLIADRIEGDSHVVAKLLANYMMKKSSIAFQQFITDVKLGVAMENAIKNAFGLELPILIAGFGNEFGVPNLTP